MNAPCQVLSPPGQVTGEREFLEREGPWHLVADWVRPVFLHFRIEPAHLRPQVPYELDLYEGWAWVSLVAFTMRDMRPSVGGNLTRRLFAPFREQRFLNVRTYVKHDGERGIHFIAEWISDWWNSKLGPGLYGSPYRHGELAYQRSGNEVVGTVQCGDGRLSFRGASFGPTGPCGEGRGTFLLERYVAFNSAQGRKRYFRVWHAPWERQDAAIEIVDDSLLRTNFRWWAKAVYDSADVSEGAFDVRMSRPRKVPISPNHPSAASAP